MTTFQRGFGSYAELRRWKQHVVWAPSIGPGSTGEDFTDDVGPKPISWWMFEDVSSPALDGNVANANDITWGGSHSRGGTGMQGAHYLNTSAGSSATRAFASLSANFPWKAATTGYTIGFWVYAKGSASTFSPLLLMSDGGSTGFKFRIGGTAGQLAIISFHTGGSVSITQDVAAFTVDGWHHMVTRWNGTGVSGAGAANEVSLWVDGVKSASAPTRTACTLETTNNLTFTGSSSAALGYDEAFVFDVPLLDTQIHSIYAHGLQGIR